MNLRTTSHVKYDIITSDYQKQHYVKYDTITRKTIEAQARVMRVLNNTAYVPILDIEWGCQLISSFEFDTQSNNLCSSVLKQEHLPYEVNQ